MRVPTRQDVRIFRSAAEFRAWLERHHDAEDELFVGYYHRGVAKVAMTYPESVEEALCFGWIDGITRRIDDEVRCTRFTPRRRRSNWSAINIDRVAALRAAGRMHPAGIRAFEERDRRNDQVYSYEQPDQALPPEWIDRFRASRAAWEHWTAETPSYRRTVTHWVLSAKRPETRERRFDALVADSAAGRRVGPMRAGRAEQPSRP